MSGEEAYRPLGEVGRRLEKACADLERGDIDIHEMDELLADIRSLEQRVIVLQYKAMENVARGSTATKGQRPAHGTLSFSFGLPEPAENAEMDPEHVAMIEDRNQISLIDSIEELSAAEKAEQKRLRKARAKAEKKKQVSIEHIDDDTPAKEKKPKDKKRAKKEQDALRKKGESRSPSSGEESSSPSSGEASQAPSGGEKSQSPPKAKESHHPPKTTGETADRAAEPSPAIEPIKKGRKDTSGTRAGRTHPRSEKSSAANTAEGRKTSINEGAKKAQSPTLAQKLGAKPIDNISKALSVNARIGVVKILFKGDGDASAAFLTALDSAAGQMAAKVLFDQEAADRGWKESSASYKKLLDLIARRFQE